MCPPGFHTLRYYYKLFVKMFRLDPCPLCAGAPPSSPWTRTSSAGWLPRTVHTARDSGVGFAWKHAGRYERDGLQHPSARASPRVRSRFPPFFSFGRWGPLRERLPPLLLLPAVRGRCPHRRPRLPGEKRHRKKELPIAGLPRLFHAEGARTGKERAVTSRIRASPAPPRGRKY